MSAAQQLHSDAIISDAELIKIKAYESGKLLSVHWELRTILYLGITLFSAGIGILIYLNIDTIGHQAVLAIFALLSLSFWRRRRIALRGTLSCSKCSCRYVSFQHKQ